MTIFWTLTPENLLPIGKAQAYLNDREIQKQESLRIPKRRKEWSLGRWTAKNLLVHALKEYSMTPLTSFSVENEPDGAPFFQVSNTALPVRLSISHSGNFAFCALTRETTNSLGVDLETIERRSSEFVEDYFTSGEKELANRLPPDQFDLGVNLIWSAKESALKALSRGLRLDTRQIEILGWESARSPQEWSRLSVGCLISEVEWSAAWQTRPGYVLTVVTASSEKPVAEQFDLQEVNL